MFMELKAINVTCFSLRWGSGLHNMTAVRDWVKERQGGFVKYSTDI